MAVYRPTYKDPATGEWRESSIWWYRFTFAGKRVRESSKSARKTVAVEAEKNRRMELERSFNGIADTRRERIRSIADLGDAFLADYKLRNPRSATFATQTMAHVKRLLGAKLAADITDATVKEYQRDRLKERAAPKTINDETGMLLRILEEQGDAIRAKMRRLKTLKLKVGRTVAKAWTPEEKAALLAEARKRRSPAIYPALVLALNSGLRDYELKDLQWARIDLQRAIVTVGDSKTEGGEGRTIPLNTEALAALVDHAKWYLDKFGETRPEWYVFPFGKPQPTDPTRPVTTLKTVWGKVKAATGLAGRWHDNRHTFITDLAESGEAADEVIQDIAGHVSKQMLKRYSHIRMEAKRRAVATLNAKPQQPVPIEPARACSH
jgi:integrase